MILTVEFQSERLPDGQIECELRNLLLEGRSLPWPKVAADFQVVDNLVQALERIAKLLPKDWNA